MLAKNIFKRNGIIGGRCCNAIKPLLQNFQVTEPKIFSYLLKAMHEPINLLQIPICMSCGPKLQTALLSNSANKQVTESPSLQRLFFLLPDTARYLWSSGEKSKPGKNNHLITSNLYPLQI